MKKNKLKSITFLVGSLFIALMIASCGDEDSPAPALTLISLTAEGVAIDGATSAEDIPVDATIVATFSEDVEATTATATSIAIVDGSATVTVSGAVVTLTLDEDLKPGTSYSLNIANTILSLQEGAFSGISVSFKTAGKSFVTPPQVDNQVAYWNFDNNANDYTGTHNTVVEEVSYTVDRQGFDNGAASFNGDGDIVEIAYSSDLISPNHTLTVWYKVSLADYEGSRFMFGLGTERGYFNEVGGGLGWFKYASSHSVGTNPSNNGPIGTAWTDPNGDGITDDQVLIDYTGSITDLMDGKWVMLAMTVDDTGMKTIYLDGQIIMQVNLNNNADWPLEGLALNDADAATVGLDSNLGIGWAGSTTNKATGWADYAADKNNNRTYKGLLDDMRIFNVALSQSEITTLYNAEK